MGIVANNLKKSFGNPPNQVLRGISMTAENGDFVSIVGRSGSGKSTLLYLLSTLDNPTEGHLELDGKDPQKMSVEELHEFRNQKIGFIFQFHYLLPELSAIENVVFPARKTNTQSSRTQRGIDLLTQFGLGEKIHRLPGQLSGGEQQRVAIARALIMEPSFLFADEPTGNLDSSNGQMVMELLVKINKTMDTSIFLVTHEKEFAKLAKRQIYLADGLVVTQ